MHSGRGCSYMLVLRLVHGSDCVYRRRKLADPAHETGHHLGLRIPVSGCRGRYRSELMLSEGGNYGVCARGCKVAARTCKPRPKLCTCAHVIRMEALVA